MKFFWLCTFISAVISAPTNQSSPHTIYDQKQTGDYNIQLHLKDIQIVAILGDELSGDYDYNYDYADFTVKPGTNVTTVTPSTSEEPSSTASPPDNQSQSTTETSTSSTTEKPTSTEKSDSVPFSTSSPDRIKVQIIEEPTPNIAIVPSDDMGLATVPALGEVLHYRKCASGYTRDKRGRCRRVRRPSLKHQFDLGRLASNLAARFRGAASEEEAIGGSRPTEN